MGLRLTHNLKNSVYEMSYLEVSGQGIKKLEEQGIKVSDPQACITGSDIVILAVPDVALEKVTAEYIPMMKPGSLAVTLDPAAALAGKLYSRSDVAYFSPTLPSIHLQLGAG
jgi:ketol-acid reductoisomerase